AQDGGCGGEAGVFQGDDLGGEDLGEVLNGGGRSRRRRLPGGYEAAARIGAAPGACGPGPREPRRGPAEQRPRGTSWPQPEERPGPQDGEEEPGMDLREEGERPDGPGGRHGADGTTSPEGPVTGQQRRGPGE